jgi:hypothetical protein
MPQHTDVHCFAYRMEPQRRDAWVPLADYEQERLEFNLDDRLTDQSVAGYEALTAHVLAAVEAFMILGWHGPLPLRDLGVVSLPGLSPRVVLVGEGVDADDVDDTPYWFVASPVPLPWLEERSDIRSWSRSTRPDGLTVPDTSLDAIADLLDDARRGAPVDQVLAYVHAASKPGLG